MSVSGVQRVAHVHVEADRTLPCGAFACMQGLQTVSFAEGVRRIPIRCFEDCDELHKVDFPLSLERIESRAFRYCVSLSHVKFRAGLVRIADNAFRECNELRTVDFDEASQLLKIYDQGFGKCYSLSVVDLSKALGLRYIGQYAFTECLSLQSVVCPPSLRMIEGHAFCGCANLVRINTGMVTRMGEGVFMGCRLLLSLDLRSLINAEVPDKLCYECSELSQVDFPPDLVEIGIEAFKCCRKLESVHFVGGSGTLRIRSGVFSQCVGLRRVTLQTVKMISDNAFEGCSQLQVVRAPAVTMVGCEAFLNCTALTHFVGDTDRKWPRDLAEISYGAFKNCFSLRFVWFAHMPHYMGYSVFANCRLHVVAADTSSTKTHETLWYSWGGLPTTWNETVEMPLDELKASPKPFKETLWGRHGFWCRSVCREWPTDVPLALMHAVSFSEECYLPLELRLLILSFYFVGDITE